MKNAISGLAFMIHRIDPIPTFVSRINGMAGWIVRNFTSKEANVVLKIYKIQINVK